MFFTLFFDIIFNNEGARFSPCGKYIVIFSIDDVMAAFARKKYAISLKRFQHKLVQYHFLIHRRQHHLLTHACLTQPSSDPEQLILGLGFENLESDPILKAK